MSYLRIDLAASGGKFIPVQLERCAFLVYGIQCGWVTVSLFTISIVVPVTTYSAFAGWYG